MKKSLWKFNLLFMLAWNLYTIKYTLVTIILKSHQRLKNKHDASGYSLFTYCSFDVTKNKHDYYRDKKCMKKFCKDLRKHATKIINYEKKEMISFTNEENQSYHEQWICYICKKEFSTDNKVSNHYHYTGKYRGAAHNICNLRYKTPK